MNLQLKNLSVGYHSPIVKNINFEIEGGQLAVLIGKNGSGKSTLLKSLGGILPVLEGEIRIDNRLIHQKEIPHYISVVLTDRPVGQLKVNEILKLGRLPYTNTLNRLEKKDKELIEKAVSELEIESLQERLFSQLSDGEKQIVMIARAIVQDTPVILLDEPTTHLDLENKARVLKLLKNLANKGKTVIFSSHDLNLLLPEVENFLVIDKGVCIRGSKVEVLNRLKNLFTKGLLIFDEKEMRFKLT